MVAKKVQQALEEEKIIQDNQSLIGKDVLTQSIMQRLVLKILAHDQKQAPFTVTGLERRDLTYQIPLDNGNTVNLSGIVDRIDEREGVTRIIDYKNWKSDFSQFKAIGT